MYVLDKFLTWLLTSPATRAAAPRPSVVLAYDGNQCAAFARFIDARDTLEAQGAIVTPAQRPCWEYRFPDNDRRQGRIAPLSLSLWVMDQWTLREEEPLMEVFVYMRPPAAGLGPSVFASFGSASQALYNRQRYAERDGERAWAVFEAEGVPAGRLLKARVTQPRHITS
jgi:hypothetical protein